MYHGLDRSRRLRFHAGVALPSTGSKPVVPDEVLAQSVVSSCRNIVNMHLRSVEQYQFSPFFLSTSRSLSTRLFLVSTIIHTTHPIPFRLRHNFVKDATYHGLSHTPHQAISTRIKFAPTPVFQGFQNFMLPPESLASSGMPSNSEYPLARLMF